MLNVFILGQVHTLRQMFPHVWRVVWPFTNQAWGFWSFLHYLCKKSQNQPVSEQKNLIPMRTCLIIYGIWKTWYGWAEKTVMPCLMSHIRYFHIEMEDKCKPFKKCFNMLNKFCGHFHKNITHEDSELICTICAKKLSNWLLMIPIVTHEWNSDWSYSSLVLYFKYSKSFYAEIIVRHLCASIWGSWTILLISLKAVLRGKGLL